MARRIRRLPRCQRRGCIEPVGRAVRVELPGTWLGAGIGDQAAVHVYVGLCPRCGREVERRARLIGEAYTAFGRALAVIDDGAGVQTRIEDLEDLLREAEGALAHQRERAQLAERELAVVERALFWLLRAVGSEVADEGDVRLSLGLPA